MTSNGPWLTIVTVNKDDPQGLTRTWESLTRQDLTGVEWLIVDSSNDRLPAQHIAQQISTEARVVWTQPEGIYPAMNIGLKLATGTYTFFLNAGDELVDGGLQTVRQVATAESPSWIVGQVEIQELSGTTVMTQPLDFDRERRAHFARGRFANHQGTFVQTSTLRDIGGFDSNFAVAADYKVFLALTQREPPRQLVEVIARFQEGGTSTRYWLTAWREFGRARSSIFDLKDMQLLRERLRSYANLGAMAWHRSPWPLVTALAALLLGFLVSSGVGVGDTVLVTAAVILQGLAGALWWLLLNRSRSVSILEAVSVGLGLGTATSMIIGLWLPWWLAPLVLVFIWLLVSRRSRHSPIGRLTRAESLGLVAGLLPGLAAIAWSIRSYPLHWQGLWTGYHGDMLFFEGLAASVARLGPGASLFMDGADLRYHSLAYGWAGQLTWSLDLAPFVVLVRVLPIVVLVGCVGLAVSWAYRLAPGATAPVIAALLIVSGGFVGTTFGTVLNFDSPSQSMTTLWLLTMSVVVLASLRSSSYRWFLIPVALLGLGLAGGKISTVAIALSGLAMLAFIGGIRRQPWLKRAVALLVIVAGATAFVYFALLSGSSEAGGLQLFSLLDRASSVQSLNPVVTTRGIVAGIAILVLAVVPRWLGVTWLMIDPHRRWSPDLLLGYGFALGGLATVLVLSGGFNDLWFAVAASAPLAVLSAVGLSDATDWLSSHGRWRVFVAVAGGVAISIVAVWMWTTGSSGIIGLGWRWAAPIAAFALAGLIGLLLLVRADSSRARIWLAVSLTAIVVAAIPSRVMYAIGAQLETTYPTSTSLVLFSPRSIDKIWRFEPEAGWTDTSAVAGEWLRQNSDPNDLVVTNMTGSSMVNALAGLPTYISTIHFQAPYGRPENLEEITRREDASWDFIENPDRGTAEPLCEAGVRWLWVDTSLTDRRDWHPFANIRYEVADAAILEFNLLSCSQ